MGTRILRLFPDLTCLATITLVIVLFFSKLFWPVPQLLVTPDFGRSDSWHFSFATKYLLWENLQHNKLPLWTDKIGDGFPIFAEGQIGTFFLPNLLIYRGIADPVLAYNVSLVATILILSWGMYAWLRTNMISPLSSLFGALSFTLSGIVVLQLPHITLLQGFSLLPWIMIVTQLVLMMPSPRIIVFLAFLISQQIFAGFPQATFLTLILASGFIIWSLLKKTAPYRHALAFLTALILGLGLAAIQLLPSWEFAREAGFIRGLSPDIASYFSFPLSHLTSFLDPFALGDPRAGTYPHFASFDGSIFWENTGFIGVVPLLLAIIAIRFPTSLTSFLFATLALAFLLMWGSHSPFYIIYSFWPFNLFRVPSRFLWIFVFALTGLASFGLDRTRTIVKKGAVRMVAILLVIFNTVSLFVLWRPYHMFAPATSWMEKPAALAVLSQEARISSIGTELVHNKVFLTTGWQNPAPFQRLRTAMAADSNLVWRVGSHDVYAGRNLRRPSILDSLLASHIRVSENVATISAVGQKLIDLFGITNLVSTTPITVEGAMQKPVIFDQIDPDRRVSLYVYANTTALPRAYLVTNTREVHSLEFATRVILDSSFEPGRIALVEQNLSMEPSKEKGVATIVSDRKNHLVIQTSHPNNAFLVVSDTYYPGWVARIDGRTVPIVPANIRYRGVTVPYGAHTVTFDYQPNSFRTGGLITLMAGLLTVLLVVFPVSVVQPQTWQKVPWRAQHFPSSRDRSKPRKE